MPRGPTTRAGCACTNGLSGRQPAVQRHLAVACGAEALSYGQLKLLPFWDPLRGDPRFEALVQKVTAQKAVDHP